MKHSIVLSQKKDKKVIKINPESPFFKITHVEILIDAKDNKDDLDFRNVTITLNQRGEQDNAWKGWTFFYGESFVAFPPNGLVSFGDIIVDTDEFNRVELVYENDSNIDVEMKVHYTTINNNVSLVNPFENFKKHIQQKDNVKIFFSAPYGQGKTTFLNHFFEQHKKEYHVFRVFPVNYSISHNEDVFKYIKVELFFQLIQSGIEFDQEEFSNLLSSQIYFLSDPVRIISPLIPLIPKIGKGLNEFMQPLLKIYKGYKAFHKKIQKDDQKLAEEFVKELYEKEGSVFEDNFYTQLIRLQLEKLKETTKKKNIVKKNVLIIEDLDRMDPDHIFRILNVFAAHFDDSDKYEGYTNKFGFDKIIIVGDYYNIKHTFEYRYGERIDFNGYINKYYSREPFFYDNKQAIAKIIQEIKKNVPKQYPLCLDLFIFVLADFVESESATLRDLIHLLKHDAFPIANGEYQKSINNSKHFYHQLVYFNLFFYLSKAFDIDSLIPKFEKCKTKLNTKTNINYHYLAGLGLPSLVLNEITENKDYSYSYQGKNLKFSTKFNYNPIDRYEFYEIEKLKKETPSGELDVKFKRTDFYEMLILNAKKYKEVAGFE